MAEAGGIKRSRQIGTARRVIDVAISSVAIVVTAPLILMAVVGSAVTLRAWPLFTQDRIGLDGRTFRFLKVRTLPIDVPSYINKHQIDHGRIPAFCRLLRRLHVDELPQLLLVVRGHMSLVGPRPEMAHLHHDLPAEFRALRTSVRPGCTGLWQISEACIQLIGVAPQYDEFYLSQRSGRLDVWILVRTVAKMLGSRRPLSLTDVPAWAMTQARQRTAATHATNESGVSLPATSGR